MLSQFIKTGFVVSALLAYATAAAAHPKPADTTKPFNPDTYWEELARKGS